MRNIVRGCAILILIACAVSIAACGSDRTTGKKSSGDPSPEPSPAAPATPSSSQSSSAVSFIAFGDWGDESDEQVDVADAIGRYCVDEACDFIVTLGDNFQDEGVTSTDDPLWQTIYRDVYGDLDIPFYATLGNHDVEGNVQAEIDYSDVDSSWHMDGEDYSFARPEDSGEPVIEFFIINAGDDEYQQGEEAWLEDALAASSATWKILVMHKPILSNGDEHGDTSLENGERLIEDICGKIDLVLSGHDHIFSYLVGKNQNFDVDCDVEQLVIGTGGGDPYDFDPDDARAVKTGAFSGFGWFEAKADSLLFRMIDTNDDVFYTNTWEK
jgi:acid phosphatase